MEAGWAEGVLHVSRLALPQLRNILQIRYPLYILKSLLSVQLLCKAMHHDHRVASLGG